MDGHHIPRHTRSFIFQEVRLEHFPFLLVVTKTFVGKIPSGRSGMLKCSSVGLLQLRLGLKIQAGAVRRSWKWNAWGVYSFRREKHGGPWRMGSVRDILNLVKVPEGGGQEKMSVNKTSFCPWRLWVGCQVFHVLSLRLLVLTRIAHKSSAVSETQAFVAWNPTDLFSCILFSSFFFIICMYHYHE